MGELERRIRRLWIRDDEHGGGLQRTRWMTHAEDDSRDSRWWPAAMAVPMGGVCKAGVNNKSWHNGRPRQGMDGDVHGWELGWIPKQETLKKNQSKTLRNEGLATDGLVEVARWWTRQVGVGDDLGAEGERNGNTMPTRSPKLRLSTRQIRKVTGPAELALGTEGDMHRTLPRMAQDKSKRNRARALSGV